MYVRQLGLRGSLDQEQAVLEYDTWYYMKPHSSELPVITLKDVVDSHTLGLYTKFTILGRDIASLAFSCQIDFYWVCMC